MEVSQNIPKYAYSLTLAINRISIIIYLKTAALKYIHRHFLCHSSLNCTPIHNTALNSVLHLLNYTVSVLGREEGYTFKYTPLPEGVPEGEARENS